MATVATRHFATLACAVMASLSAASLAGAEQPSYIKADASALTKAYGPELTSRILSDELTQQRLAALAEGVKIVPDLQCPADATFVVQDIFPTTLPYAGRFWVERLAIHCNRDIRFRLLFNENGGAIKAIPLVPGDTMVGAILEKDARQFVAMSAQGGKPEGCEQFLVVDTAVVNAQTTPEDTWIERWTASMCGKLSVHEVTFTPTPADGGTDISVHAVK